ncbi:hypothetical protein BG015_008704 [Linnemannia schmuckeri]|uniref:Chromatin assembly factor 1 subunit A n=1 Tax=Linnemannia schmuckeri TaxID=64567 RepID=A0A9P5VA44_9FUNG|nr:hypothetical protein BG015_008704 [Linnemannia schmuckeri]
MPPKSSSPTMTKTLSAFFTKADNAPTTNTPPATQPAEPAVEAAPQPAETPVAESPKPKKRASRAKKPKDTVTENDTSADSTTTTASNIPATPTAAAAPKSPAKSRKTTTAAAKKETMAAVLIPSFGATETKSKKDAYSAQQPAVSDSTPTTTADSAPKSSPSKKASKTATSPDTSATGEATLTPIPLGSSDITATTAKEAPKSPSKTVATVLSTNSNGVVATTAAATSSSNSNMSKVNKIDTASMFKVRSGKASFTENKLKFSAHPSAIADLCKFHEYREKLQEATDLSQFSGVKLEADCVEITSIPQEHYGLIAKLPTLCPLGFDAFAESAATPGDTNSMDIDLTMEDADANQSNSTTLNKRTGTSVSVTAIMEVIQSVAQRVNYGVPIVNLPGQAYMTPANLSVFRWEVQDIDQYFPSDMRAAVVRRRTKRLEASAALTAWFLGLDAKQQEDLAPPPVLPVVVPDALLGAETGSLSVSQRGRLSLGGAEKMDIDKEMAVGPLLEGQPTVEAAVDPAVLELKLKEAENKKKEAEAKEERRLEKERKMAERQQEKDQKEAERLQKEEAKKKKAEEDKLKQDQRAQKFVGFFKNAASAADKKDVAHVVNGADCSATPATSRFHPFHVKKNTALAPINRFASEPRSSIIDKELGLGKAQQDSDKDAEMQNGDADMMDVDMEVAPSLDTAAAKITLSTLFSRTRRTVGSDAAKPRTKKRLPQSARDMSVADVIQSGLLLQEDQDNDDMSSMLTWKDIPALRMRLLQFAENYRPAYYGTWSKRSKSITGRRFLGKDTDLVDYDFDSEAEWEEDEEGEECKSDDDDDDADELGSEQEEEDDWLVPEGYLSDDEGLDAGDEGGAKEMSQKKSKDLRRPTLAHTAPVIVGPVFEMTLGEVSTYPALEAYHIEFVGDYGVGMEMYYAAETTSGHNSSLVPTLPADIQI